MFKRAIVFVGTVCSGALIVLGLLWFLNSSVPGVYAKSPAANTANSVLPRPLNQVPPGCISIDFDIATNTTWTGSCYHVMTNTVTVYAGVSLVINPPSAGTWIYFEDGAQLQVLGDLQALGTPARSITFTAVHPPTPWVGIILEQDAGGDRIQYSVIEYAQTGVRINDEDTVTIQLNTLRHNRLGVTGGGGISGDTDDSTITNNTIYDCSNGIALNESFGNDISDNTIYDIDQYGVALVAKTTVGGDDNTINDNEIHDCDLNGIRLENGLSNSIQGNTVYQCGSAGMVIDQQSRASIQGNQVFNTAQDAGALTGILITNSSENVELRANQVISNGSGLGGYAAAVYVEGMLGGFTQLVVNDNVIHDTYGTGIYYAADNNNEQTLMQTNAICSVPSYELDNQRGGPHIIDARYGWWGTNTPAASVNGPVNITPWITLSVTTVPTAVPGNLGSTVNVLVTMNDGAGHTVPEGARQVHLASSSGMLNPSVVTLDGNGQALSTFTLTEIPPGDQVAISATAFCDYITTTILTVERTNVAIDKAVSVAQVMAGDQLVYQITYSNTTDVVATNVYITDSLPAGTTWAGDTATANGWTRLSTSPQPIWFVPTLPPGAYGSFVLMVDVPAGAACGALLTNQATIGTETIEETTTDNSASAGPVTVIVPSVVVTKTGDALSKIGDLVTYEFQITNNSCPAGSPDLVLDSIVDTGIGWAGLGDLTSSATGCGLLSVGASCSFTVQRTVPVGAPDPMSDNVTVHYYPDGFTVDVSDSDTHAVNLFQPSITFNKSGDALSKVGDDVNYALTLNNTSSSDTPNLVCTITDPMLGINQSVTLASGDSRVINATYTVPAGASDPLVNTAQVSCSPTGFPNVLTDSDSHSVNLFQPSITFDKSGDALSKVGDDVNYALTLNNTSSSDTPSLVCTITDAMLGINQSVTLASGSSRVINATYTVPAGASDPLVNTAQVSCSPTGFPNVLTDSDSHSVDLFQPSIQVGKIGPTLALVSETITYTFRITNTSSSDSPPLILDSVTDVGSGWSGLGDLTAIALHDCSSLSVGASCSFAMQYTLPDCNTSPLTNTVTARYRPWGFSNVISNSDSHAMEVQCAVDLVVEKDDDVGPTSPLLRSLLLRTGLFEHPMQVTQYRDFVGPGDLVTYTVFVRNIGPVTATNIVLSDTLPDFTTYVGYGWQQVGTTQDYTIAVRDLPPGDIEAVSFVVRLDDPLPTTVRSIINDQACGSSAEPDLNYDDNCDLEDSPVRWVRLDVSKEANPLSVRPGEQVTYTITVTNLGQAIGDGTSSGITITDALPDGFTWVTDTASSAGLTRLSTQPPIWYRPALTVSERISFDVIAQVTTTVDTADCMNWLPNVVTTRVRLGDQVHEWSAVADVNLYCLPNLFVTKHDDVETGAPLLAVSETDADQPHIVTQLLQEAQASNPMAPTQPRQFVFEGDLVTYTITVINTGAYTATGVVLTETLPLYTDYVGYGWTHGGGRTYVLAVGALAPYDWRIYQFVVRVADDVPSGVNRLTNLVCGGSIGEDLDPSDNCRYEDTPVMLRPSVDKTVAVSTASAGEILTFTITYSNPNDSALTGVVITDTLPPDAHWQDDTALTTGWTTRQVMNGQVIWSRPTLAANEHGSFVLSVVISPTNPSLCGTMLTNVITLSILNNGEGYFADSDAATFDLACSVDLVIDVDDEIGLNSSMAQRVSPLAPLPASPEQAAQYRDFVRPGDLITYVATVTNRGWVTATGVIVSDTLPLYTTYVDQGYGWQRVGTTRYYTLALPDLPPGASQTVRFVVQVDDPLPSGVLNIVNYMCVCSAEPDSNPADNCVSESAPVLGLTISKVANPTSVQSGQLVTYTIALDNLDQLSGFGPSGDITITDALPAGFTYVADTAASAGFTRRAITPVVIWDAPTTALGSSVSFTLIARAPAAINCGNWMTNTVTTSLMLNGQPYDWTATASVWILCPIDLLVLKDDDVGPTTLMSTQTTPMTGAPVTMDQILQKAQVNAPSAPSQHRSFVREGDLITYTIVVANAGTSAVTNVTVSETLPLYTDYVGYGWTHLGGRTYTMAAGTLPPGGVGIYYFVVRVQDTLPDGVENLINRVCGWADEPDQYPQNNCNYEDTPVRRWPLQVTKAAEPCISPGDAFDYTITYQNISTGTTFYNVPLTDTLDPYVSYTTGSGWHCDGQICDQTIPVIPPGVSGTLQLPVQLSAGLPATRLAFTNTVVISGGDRFVLVTPVDTAPDLSVLKNDNVGPLPLVQQAQWDDMRQRLSLSQQPASIQATQQREFVYPGELITYTILYVNSGQTTATNVVLTERLPDYTSYVGGGWTYAGGQQYTFNVGDLAPGQGGELHFIVRVSDFFPPDEDRVINLVDIAGREAECNLSNNQSGEDTPVHPYPLQVIKTADTCIMPGDEFNYYVTYQNNTTDTTYSNVVLTDTLSPYVTHVNASGWTCTGQTCNRTVASIPPGGSDSFLLPARLSASFPYTMQTVFTNVVAISGGNRYLLLTSIDVGPDLALVKNDNVGLAPPGLQQREVVSPGELITYTIIYLNGGLGPATDVVLTETLPQYTTYAGDASWQDAGGGLYTRSVGDLPAGQGGMTSFVVQVSPTLPSGISWIINLVEIGSATPECDLTDNWSTEQTPVRPSAGITFTLHKDGPMSTYPNSVITYTIVTVNNGPPASGVSLSDAVPNGTIFIPGSCSYSINGGPDQLCNSTYPDPSDVMWQEDLATGDRVVTTFAVRVAVGTMGVVTLRNCATLDWGSGQMTDCADTMVVLPFLEKTGPAAVYFGERITYTIVSENNTEMPIPDATLSDPIPNGTVFIPGTCTYSINGGAAQPCDPDYPDPSDAMWQEDLAPGDRVTTTFSVAVTTGSMGVVDVQNCATLGWEGSQTVDCFTTRVSPSGMGAIKTAPRVACQNDVITYTIVASNTSGVAMPGVVLSDTIPNGAIYVPGSCRYQVNAGPLQPCGPPPVLWQEDFAPGDHITTTFAVTVTAGTMGWPIGNCAVFNWGGRQIWACATTTVGRCDQRVYVANRDSGTVDVFDLNGFGYVDTIPMGINPFGMVAIGDFLFAVDFDEPSNRGRLYVVNTLLDRVVDAPLVGAHPVHIAAYDHHIYVASHSSPPAITVYDYVSGTVVARPVLDRHLTYEFGFFGATTDESRGCVYLTKRDFGSIGIWRICPPTSNGPWIPEFIYATNEANREKPSSILYHPDLDRVYVTFGLIDQLWVFDPETWQLVEPPIATGVQDPTDPGYGGHGLAALGECVFVANYLDQSVTAVVDGSCVDRTSIMATQPGPSTSRIHRVYLPLVIKNLSSGQQGPQQQRIVTIPVNGRPKGLVAGAGNLLFVTMPEDGSGNPLNRVAVIDTETLQVIDEIQSLGDHPHTAVLRPMTASGTSSQPSGTLLLP